MKVSSKSSGIGATPQVGGAKASGAAQPAAPIGATPPAGDAVSVSSTSQFVAVAMAQLALIPDIRSEKVEALKARLDSDDYNPDPEAVAEGLVQQHTPPRRT